MYTNQELIELYLKRELSLDELGTFDLLVSAVDAYIDDLIGGSFGNVSESTRYYDGGSRILDIDTCTEVTAVTTVDSEEAVNDTYDTDIDYEARPRNSDFKNYLEKRNGRFPSGVANIAVTAKFAEGLSVPDDIKYLATYLAGSMLTSSYTGNLKSESIEGYSRTFATFGDFVNNDSQFKTILNKYIKNDVYI